MDPVGFTSIVVAVGGLLLSCFGYLREREKLRTLERVVVIMEKMDPLSRSWKALNAVQEDLVLNVFREYVGRVAIKKANGSPYFLASILIFSSSALSIGAGIASQTTEGMDPHVGVPLVLFGSGLLLTGLVTLFRAVWIMRRQRGRSSADVDALFESAGFVRGGSTR